MKTCMDCPAEISNHAVRCTACKAARKKLTRNLWVANDRKSYRGVKAAANTVKPKKKRELTEAQIDAHAIAIDKENRRVELELAERAARLPSHLIAARIMRGVCVSVLY